MCQMGPTVTPGMLGRQQAEIDDAEADAYNRLRFENERLAKRVALLEEENERIATWVGKHLGTGLSRAEWHDKAWALYQAKTFDDTALARLSVHTLRAVFDATYDALTTPNA